MQTSAGKLEDRSDRSFRVRASILAANALCEGISCKNSGLPLLCLKGYGRATMPRKLQMARFERLHGQGEYGSMGNGPTCETVFMTFLLWAHY